MAKEVCGAGFFWTVELEPERADGAPLAEGEYKRYFKGVLSRRLMELGLICRFDDKADPVIQYSPPLVADREIIGKIAEITDQALTDLERELGYRGRVA
jgi:adenosylmethionine-8-amino-7-oxononanoate aminotransferase